MTIYLWELGNKRMGNAHGSVKVIKYLAQLCLVCCQNFWYFSDHVLYFTCTKAKFQFTYLIEKQTGRTLVCSLRCVFKFVVLPHEIFICNERLKVVMSHMTIQCPTSLTCHFPCFIENAIAFDSNYEVLHTFRISFTGSRLLHRSLGRRVMMSRVWK